MSVTIAAPRRRPVIVAALLVVGMLAATFSSSAAAATVSQSWLARVGPSGNNGTAAIRIFTTGTGSLYARVAHLRASTVYPITIRRGTCSSPGTIVLRLPSLTTTTLGTSARTLSLSAGQVGAIRAATRYGGRIAIRIGEGSLSRCGTFARATLSSPSPSPTASAALTPGPSASSAPTPTPRPIATPTPIATPPPYPYP